MRRSLLAIVCAGSLLLAGPASTHDDPLPSTARGLVPPPGFLLQAWGSVPAPTSITFGPDTRGGSSSRLYAASMDGNVYVMDVGPTLGPSMVFASGFRQPLGIVSRDDGTLLVSDSYLADGRTMGMVAAVRDLDGDGIGEHRRIVVSGLPNGRHNTNGLAIGSDGSLYIANGNSTDDGVECGPPPLESVECAQAEATPYSGAILAVDPEGSGQTLTDVRVVAKGFRNIYDLAFHPDIPGKLYTAMNGPDDPAADDLLFFTDASDGVVDDMGFPSCLYNPHHNPFLVVEVPPHDHSGHGESLEPEDNLNPDVIQRFGPCDRDGVTRPIASFGGHVSADGLAFAPSGFGEAAGDLFVTEWGNIWGLEDGHVSGHKVVRVDLDATGSPIIDHHTGKPSVTEFMTGGFPIDVIFDEGSMVVADFSGAIWRISRV